MDEPSSDDVYFLHGVKMSFEAAQMYCSDVEGLQQASVIDNTDYSRSYSYIKSALNC